MKSDTEIALYFPGDQVPESPWFTQVLLYWDSAAAIAPSRFLGDYLRTEYMDELIGAGLLRLIDARETIDESGGAEFDEQFLSFLDTQNLPKLSRSSDEIMLDGWEILYPRLFEEFVKRGLASENRVGLTILVEQQSYELLIMFTAGFLCRINPSLYPVTDSTRNLAVIASGGSPGSATRFRSLRDIVISNALSIPARSVPAVELAAFKDDHGEELLRLQRFLNSRIIDLSLIDDEHVRRIKIDAILQEIRDDTAVLSERMSKRSWPKVVFAGVGGVVASALTIGSVVAAGGGNAVALALGIGGGAVSMGSSVYQSADLIHASRLTERAPLAYAALAESKFSHHSTPSR